METIEIVAANVNEALEKGAAQLGVSVSDLGSEVTDETKGLFGKPGKVTVKIWSKAKPKAEPKAAKKEKAEAAPKEAVVETEAPAEEPKKRPSRRTKKDVAPAAESNGEATKAEASEEEVQPEVVASQEDADKLLGILNHLLKVSELDAEAKITALNGRYVHIDIDGQEVGYLVGRRGEVLNSIQYLMNVISARQLNNGVRVVVEGDNYRERRANALGDMAKRIAAQVIERGEEAVLDALPAFERRIIHQALVEIDGISTYSEGEEPNRCVVIAPAGD
ncbi:MAG: KH domain-containing protein [Fimbriimonadaceae bacterium]|nr:MAG: KH domain-containing protein [Fimbriimonadaceae bacterium]